MPLDFTKIANAPAFACLEKDGMVSVHLGTLHEINFIDEIHTLAKNNNSDIIFALPFCSIKERGLTAHGDEPILALISESDPFICTRDEFKNLLPQSLIELSTKITPSLSDEEHESRVSKIKSLEIEGGNASQINFARVFHGALKDYSLKTLLSIYRNLLEPRGQYMTFLLAHKIGESYHALIGATPECHLSVDDTETIMMPIAGTLRKEDLDTFEYRLHQFLTDPKEINELYQVTDEELKMMGRICPEGGYFKGPFLKEIGNVIHTYYSLNGKRVSNPLNALRHTLHAPTVVGSPMESAAKIIKQYEGISRRYYAGEIGIYKYKNKNPAHEFGNLDTGILIRSAEIFKNGEFRVQAGGGIVRDSDPVSEAKETKAKASIMLNALTGNGQTDYQPYLTDALHDQYHPILMHRNKFLSKFWMNDQSDTFENLNKTITIINNEDDFAFMIKHVVEKLGCTASVVDTFEFDPAKNVDDLIIIGPGPGDINDPHNPRMVKLLNDMHILKNNQRPLLGICLGHQALSVTETIAVVRQKQSTQGLQKTIFCQGDYHRLAFYNSFSPVFSATLAARDDIAVDLDEDGRIIAMKSKKKGKNFIGFQFHPESIMSETGKDLLANAIKELTQI